MLVQFCMVACNAMVLCHHSVQYRWSFILWRQRTNFTAPCCTCMSWISRPSHFFGQGSLTRHKDSMSFTPLVLFGFTATSKHPIVYFTKRGSAWCIVREAGERQTEKRKCCHQSSAEIGDQFTLSLPQIRTLLSASQIVAIIMQKFCQKKNHNFVPPLSNCTTNDFSIHKFCEVAIKKKIDH